MHTSHLFLLATYAKRLRLDDAVKVIDEMKLAVLDRAKLTFIPIILMLIQP